MPLTGGVWCFLTPDFLILCVVSDTIHLYISIC
uniref:Uncharacterized protein n=1 Tax=Anguilla anguilla TaxID=7936 RepID=A0A0E9QC84_ANGAN